MRLCARNRPNRWRPVNLVWVVPVLRAGRLASSARVRRGSFSHFLQLYADEAGRAEIRGEYVLVIAGKSEAELRAEETEAFADLTPAEHVAWYEAQGFDRKEAMKKAAKDRGISRRELYHMLL